MANENLIALLRQGTKFWNEWVRANPEADIDLVEANLKGVNLQGADLNSADFREAELTQANLVNANLSFADLRGADLSWANLQQADLKQADLRGAELEGTNLNKAYLRGINLRTANLRGADLQNTNLIEADLNSAILEEADLKGALLMRAQALDSNFEWANLTAACLQDWNTNSATNFSGVTCDYVYLRHQQQQRRPISGNFAPGEFTKLFQKAQETVDLIFRNGIDWQAFVTSFQKLQYSCGSSELFIQAIENKNDGAFVIRIGTPPDINKAVVEQNLKQGYELALKAMDEKYQYQLRAKDEQIAIYRQQSTNLNEMAKLMAGRPINVEAIAVAENNSNSDKSKVNMTFQGAVGNAAGNVENSRIQAIQHNYAPEQRQTLAEAAQEIQELLKQLEVNNPTATEAEQKAFVTAAIAPTRRARVLTALQAGGKEALKEFLDNPYLNVVIAIIEGWKESA